MAVKMESSQSSSCEHEEVGTGGMLGARQKSCAAVHRIGKGSRRAKQSASFGTIPSR